jgi:replicative DNA helicase Mcm
MVSIIATGNPKWGEWDADKGIPENINFPAYLLSRFDIVTCSVKSNSVMKQAIASKILGLDPITQEQGLEPLLSENELLQYINYCKKLQPTLTHDARLELKNFYEQMSELTEGETKVVPMTPRELEGMIRLATARAKLLQKEHADLDDIEAIKELKKKAISSFPGITVKSAGQQLSLLTEMDKKEKTKEDIIFQCKDNDGLVDSSQVIKKWVEAGIFKTEQRAEREFQNLVGERFFLRGSKYKYKS